MKHVLEHIKASVVINKKLLAILIDPDKQNIEALPDFITLIKASVITHIFIGGSTVEAQRTETLVLALKRLTDLPLVLFPGDVTQITEAADAVLFLSLISGDNPDFLIGKHVKAARLLRNSNLEIIPTGYLLIESGAETAVQRVTKTQPLKNCKHTITDTAKAGELLGLQLIYLEAGSGAVNPVSGHVIKGVKNDLNIPLIVGGGIRSKQQLDDAYAAGADLVVIGTAFENNNSFFEELESYSISGRFLKAR
ncbi:geranylgeranylglyceryl/heptaprenylglyceryl phosphate synthase [Bizionia saleffrena]|uniref:Geranylgeranylglyceryl phosphate synthase n=1 Tax=Bizionia saleffrena TaxID=291189 RepID=A0A8H2LCF7_9FLAO|nr:geranylgeranylglyceryl/heptaprenylglyceryl phosphate synthase [Bizionia saleffrena]TYB70698.1 geranylgeranylglyceryl/heptaprenylglyceryl phosphate synthase [Bizionia saleffrena]